MTHTGERRGTSRRYRVRPLGHRDEGHRWNLQLFHRFFFSFLRPPTSSHPLPHPPSESALEIVLILDSQDVIAGVALKRLAHKTKHTQYRAFEDPLNPDRNTRIFIREGEREASDITAKWFGKRWQTACIYGATATCHGNSPRPPDKQEREKGSPRYTKMTSQ